MRLGIMTMGCALSCALWLGACSDDDSDGSHENDASENTAGGGAAGRSAAGRGGAGGATASAAKVDRAAFEATGLNKYLGKAKPAETQTEGDEAHYFFDEADGPVCIRGERFAMATRDRGADDLMIYLQGGGSCTTALCRATETANPQIPAYGVLNRDDTDNPVADWNVVFSPYCDGSLHFGDADIPDQNRKHHGLRNVSAALDVARDKFPNPRRALLTGASAGGYATIWMTSLVRLIYPDAELFVFNDAGIAISNPASPDGFRDVLGEWGAQQFIPEDCDDCRSTPHLTAWMSWNLKHDPTLTQSMFSSYEDSVIAGTFLMLDPQIFKQELLDQTAKVVDSAPDRAKRFLVEGTQHTAGNIHTTAVGELPIAQWLEQMIERDEAWDNQLQ